MITYLKNTSRLSKITFVYEGSNMEEESEAGCTHLLEHLMFKKTLEPLESELAKKGISMNAETSYMSTLYYVEGLDKYLKQYAQQIYDIFANYEFNITEKELEEEKKIIIAEYDDYFSDNSSIVVWRAFAETKKTYSAIGKKESIENITLNQLKQLYDKSHKEMIKIVVTQASDWVIQETKKLKMKSDSFNSYNKMGIINYPQTLHNRDIAIVFSELTKEEQNVLSTVGNMLTKDLSAPLYRDLREDKQLIYQITFFNEFLTKEDNVFCFMTSSSKKNHKLIIKTIQEYLSNPEKWLTEELLSDYKEEFQVSLEMQDFLGFELESNIIHEKKIVPEKVLELRSEHIIKTMKNLFENRIKTNSNLITII